MFLSYFLLHAENIWLGHLTGLYVHLEISVPPSILVSVLLINESSVEIGSCMYFIHNISLRYNCRIYLFTPIILRHHFSFEIRSQLLATKMFYCSPCISRKNHTAYVNNLDMSHLLLMCLCIYIYSKKTWKIHFKVYVNHLGSYMHWLILFCLYVYHRS